MAHKDPRIDAYIANAAPFAQPILKHLREIVHLGCPGVQETLKWSMPHFDYKGIMCGMAAFKQHCTFGFWKASLIFDDDPKLNTEGMGQFGCITAISDLPPKKRLIGYVRKAAKLNQAGIKLPRAKPAKKERLEVPSAFVAALRNHLDAKKTFAALSPSKQREYVEWITEAKRDATREQRLATSIEWLAEGKQLNWRYLTKKR